MTAVRGTLFDLFFSKRIGSLRLSTFRGNGLISVFKYSCMQTRQCECVYTYTGSVTDRRFVLQWASPRRERQAKGWISFWNSYNKKAFWGHRWEESLIEGLTWCGWWWRWGVAEAERTEWWVQYHQQDLSWIMMKSRKTAQAWKEVSVSFSPPISLSFCLPSFLSLVALRWVSRSIWKWNGFLYGKFTRSLSLFWKHFWRTLRVN